MRTVRSRSVAACALLAGAALAQDTTQIDALMKQRKFEQALPLVEQAIAEHGEVATLLYLRSVCEGQVGRHGQAVATATAALALDPECGAAYAERAYNHAMLGHLDEALADYDRATKLQPDNPSVFGERGDLLLKRGRLRDAVAAYDRAIELAPMWPNPHSQRGIALAALTDYAGAARSFRRALQLDPKDLYSAVRLTDQLFEVGEGDEALAEMQRLARKEQSYRLLMLRGRLAFQLGRYDLAAEELGKVAARGDALSQVNARISLGALQLAEGRFEQAREALDYEVPEEAAVGAPWCALMRWCAERRLLPAEQAADNLRQALGEPDALVAKLCATCLDDPAPALPTAATDSTTACPQLFFAAWRALAEGDDDSGWALLLRCVNTGRKEYQQWQLARDLLQRRLGPDGLEVHIGAKLTIEVDQQTGARHAVVAALDEHGAAALQGLAVGDVVERVADLPYDPEGWIEQLATLRVGYDQHLTLRRGEERLVHMIKVGWRRRPR